MLRLLSLSSAVIVALLLLGCGQVAQKAVEQASGVKVDQKGDSVTYSKDGAQVAFGTGAKAPEEFRDFPVPQGFTVEASVSVSSSNTTEGGVMVSWRGRGTVASVVDFYKKSLSGQGWQEKAVIQMGDATQLMYAKGKDEMLLQISQEDEEVGVQAIMGKPTS